MHRRDPVKILITLGFGSLLVLMSALAFISLSQMNATAERMSRLVGETSAKARAANAMRDYAQLRGNALIEMYVSADIFERERIRLKMSEYGQGYRDAFELFQSYDLGTSELRAVDHIKQITSDARSANNAAAEELLIQDDPERALIAFEAANAGRMRVVAALDELITLQDQTASSSLEDSMNYHRRTQNLIVVIAAAAFVVGTLISLLVIRETGRKNSAMRYQASHDALTRLANRNAFEQRLDNALVSARDNSIEHALCYLDLDQFKIVNDTCGHKAGDELLKQITHVIRNQVRERDMLGRLGGDEFGLLLENCAIDKALEICEGIVAVVKKHDFVWEGRCYHVGVSIGLVPVSSNTGSAAKIMAEADMACYAAKDMGRNRVHIHELEGRHVRKMQQELSWVADITSTIEANRFLLFAQPIVPCADHEERMMFEVLLRIRDGDGNIVSPGQYLPAAERFSLMREVDMWVTSEAIRFLSRRSTEYPDENLMLFINLSANSISDTTFCEHVRQQLGRHSLPPGSLCFEITETAAIKNIDTAIAIIEDLRRLHCIFALDDFGSGMSSLSYLKNLPVDFLKIDGTIVQNIDTDQVNRAMVAAINEIGRVMNIRTVAEFVENTAVFEHVRELGIDYAQGFHISKPCALEEIRTHRQRSRLYRV